MAPPREHAAALALLFPYLSLLTVCKHSLWQDILSSPVTQPRAVCAAWLSRVVGAGRGRAATTTSGLALDDLGAPVDWALGTNQGGGVLGSVAGAQKE
jgi:hypothetical protein